jgi:hypothetical protein
MKSREKKRNLVENCLNQVKLHPLSLNYYVSDVLPSKSKLDLLDSSLVWLEDDIVGFDGLKTYKYENDEWREKSKYNSPKSETNINLKNNQSASKNKVKIVCALEPETNVYKSEHFKWLLENDNRLSDLNILSTNNVSFEDFVNKKFFSLENYFGKNTTLTKKLVEFCEWARSEFDCSEHEVDPITLMKIFSVNYESEPLMFMTINLEESNCKSLLEKLKFSNLNIPKPKPTKKNCRYLKKSLWTKVKDKTQLTQSDIILSSKFAKYESVRLFSDFFNNKCKQRVPYSFKETRLPKI